MAALVLQLGLTLLSIPALGAAAYLFLLAVCSRLPRPRPSLEPRTRFDVVVPAHDEELGIAATVTNLLATDYPESLRRVLVVADNCSDATAERASAAGAMVLVRTDDQKRGKGYALQHAMQHCLAEGKVDAIVVVDADSLVSPGLLQAFATRFELGAPAVQADYGVRNPQASWRTRLMVIALSLFHVVRSSARENLGLSCGLRGNGMGFSAGVLREAPYDAFSIVEDAEYGIRLGFAGHRVHYVHEAKVWGEMVSTEGSSRSQRVRWESGRGALAKSLGPRLLREALSRRSKLLLDLAMDLLVPPLSSLVLAIAAGALASAAVSAWARAHGAPAFAWIPWIVAMVMMAVYVGRGVVVAQVGWAGVRDLAWAPVYIIWKMALRIRGTRKPPREWVRTTREEKR